MHWDVDLRLTLGALGLDVELSGDDTPVALIGPNGSGKTTLLRTIAGAHRPESGTIRIGERTLFDAELGVDLPPEERRVGYVPQGYGLFPHLSVIDNVAFGWTANGQRQPRRRRRQLAVELLKRMDCSHLVDRTPSGLSGGEQQRVALARALMIDPQILLLDEPLAAMDAAARRTLRAYLADYLAERAAPSIVVSHDARDLIALRAVVYVIDRGRIVQRGTVESLAAAPANDFVAEFFGSLA